MAPNNSVKVARSKTFVTPAFRAVFPTLNKPDKFGSYSVTCDALEHPEIEETIRKQIEAFLPEAQEKLASKKKPTNDFVREGTFEKGDRKGQDFRLLSFKMKASRKDKNGNEIPQRPALIDSKRLPVNALVFGGSKVKAAYYLQYTITPTGTFMSVKLSGVQVIEYVGPTGELDVNSLFDEEDGYVAPQGVSVPVGTDSQDEDGIIKGGEDF